MKTKMQHDCNKGGIGKNCFNRRFRLRFDVFDGCFPRNLSPTDIDLFIEVNGAFLISEWKSDGVELGKGQRIAFERFTQHYGNLVIIVHGDPEKMTVHSFRRIQNGEVKPEIKADLNDLKDLIRRWATWVEKEAWN